MSAAVLGVTVLHNLLQYMTIIKDIIVNRKKPKLGTHHINKFYESAVFLEFAALGDVLDIVAPYNGKNKKIIIIIINFYIIFLKIFNNYSRWYP